MLVAVLPTLSLVLDSGHPDLACGCQRVRRELLLPKMGEPGTLSAVPLSCQPTIGEWRRTSLIFGCGGVARGPDVGLLIGRRDHFPTNTEKGTLPTE